MDTSIATHTEKLSFWQHVGVLRIYILWGAALFIASASLIFVYSGDVLARFLLRPLHGQELVFLSPVGPFLFEMKVAFVGAFIACFPVWLLLALHFVRNTLSPRRRAVSLIFVFVATLFGLASIFVSYVYLIPLSLTALAHFVVAGTSLMLTAESYFSFVILSMIVTFFILELPVVIVALSYARVLNPYSLANRRPALFIGLLALLAILTPTTDIVTLAIVAIPMMILVEVGLVFAKRLYNTDIKSKYEGQ